jgi:hypothetical protein
MGKIDQTLFLLRQGKDILIVQVYVDDIIFGGSSNSLVARFAEDVSREFEMSCSSSTIYRSSNQRREHLCTKQRIWWGISRRRTPRPWRRL